MKALRQCAWVLLACLPSAAAAQAKSVHAASTADRSVALNAKLCGAATEAQKSKLPDPWTPFRAGVLACPLKSGKSVVLYILSADGEAFAQTVKPGQVSPSLPAAWIVMPDGTHIGTLPFAFPYDPPVSLDVTFTKWSQGWPQELRLYLEDPSVSGNHRLPPMKWDPSSKTFVTTGDAHGR